MLQRALTRRPSRLLRLHPISAPSSLTITPRIFSTSSYPHLSTTSSSIPPSRSFHSSPLTLKGITPDSADPQPNLAGSATPIGKPAEISDQTYHERADAYIDELVSKLEHMQEEKEDVDCEYSAGVLNFVFPPAGTYVLNKQPPNKQIWLSSPLSGPKRYDYVIQGEGQHEKEGSGQGKWVYLRDGTTLTGLLRRELGVVVGSDGQLD